MATKGTVNRQSVKNGFISFWQKRNFKKEEHFSVIPPEKWISTIFINSGLIRYLELVKKNGAINFPLTSCQPCIKIGSGKFSLNEMLLRDGYFTFFEQLTCGADADSIPIRWFIKNVWDYLILTTGLPPEKIYVGVHSSQEIMADDWIKAGLSKENIVFPDSEASVLSLPAEDVHGIYSPFFFDRGINHPLSCQKKTCHINCGCGRFLELGDIGLISVGDKKIIDHGIGLERMTSIQAGLTRVTDILEFSIFTSLLGKEFGSTHPYLIVLADHLRSIIVLLLSGLKPGNKKGGHVLRSLIRRTFWLTFGNTIFEKEKIVRIFKQASLEMKDFYPYLSIDNRIMVEIEKEIERYDDFLIRSRKIIKKHQKRKESETPSEQDLAFFYQTHGISEELTKILWKEH